MPDASAVVSSFGVPGIDMENFPAVEVKVLKLLAPVSTPEMAGQTTT